MLNHDALNIIYNRLNKINILYQRELEKNGGHEGTTASYGYNMQMRCLKALLADFGIDEVNEYPNTLELEEDDLDYCDDETIIVDKQIFDDFIPNCIVNIHCLDEDTVVQYRMIYDTEHTIIFHKI